MRRLSKDTVGQAMLLSYALAYLRQLLFAGVSQSEDNYIIMIGSVLHFTGEVCSSEPDDSGLATIP